MTTIGSSVYWLGSHAFFSASNVSLVFDDGLVYSFQDDENRPLVVNTGGAGEEISREDDWHEEGVARRLKFYFADGGFESLSNSNMQWELYESRAYDRTAEWVYSNYVFQQGDSADTSIIGIPSSIVQNQTTATTLFHCDEITFDYVPSSSSVGAKSSATLHAKDVYLGAYFATPFSSWEHSICQLDVYNPCRINAVDDKSYCVARNAVVTCQAPPTTTTTTSSTSTTSFNVQQARTFSISSSTSDTMTLDSRKCPITTDQVQGPEEGEVPVEEEIEKSTSSTEGDPATEQVASSAVNTHKLSLLVFSSLFAVGFSAFTV